MTCSNDSLSSRSNTFLNSKDCASDAVALPALTVFGAMADGSFLLAPTGWITMRFSSLSTSTRSPRSPRPSPSGRTRTETWMNPAMPVGSKTSSLIGRRSARLRWRAAKPRAAFCRMRAASASADIPRVLCAV